MINCIRSSYDLQSEDFTVSLLRHESQYVVDLQRYPDMTPADQEYRAKLVELIYTRSRNLLEYFVQQRGSGEETDGHSLAANQLVDAFARITGLELLALGKLPVGQVQSVAMELFQESEAEMPLKYAAQETSLVTDL